jgi:hypothetical protein
MKAINYVILTFLISKISSSLLFKLNEGQEQCFHDDFYSDSSVILKWKIFTQSRENVSSILPTINIQVTSTESKEKIYETKLITNKNKATFTVIIEGQYKICMNRKKYTGSQGPKEQVYANLKINSNNMDDINLEDVVSYEDLGNMYNKTDDIKFLTEQIINSQNSQMDIENESSKDTIYYTIWYKYITLTQIGLTLIVGIVQLVNFRRFLKSQHVIN